VSIPNTVEYIGQEAFARCAALKTVSSSSVKYIHWGAFQNCPELETVSVANSVVSIGREAFAYCPKFKHLNGVTSIDSIANHAFRQCPSLETVGGQVRHVGYGAFAGSEKLRTAFTGMEYISATAFSGCSSLEAASVSSAKYIGEDAFLGCRSLSSEMFIIAENVGQRAFYNCSAIPKVHINNTVKYIRKSAFYGCSGMEELTFGENPELEIGNCAFMGCYGLRDVTIRGKIIGTEAFRDCYDETGGSGAPQQAVGNYRKNRGNTGGTGLKNVTIDNSVTTIKNEAFYGCRSLETITIGNSVDTIEQGAFSNCSGLKGTLTFPPSVKFLGSSACWGCGMTNVALSPSLEIIQSGTFYECPNLESIDIPAKVKIIDDWAFYKCPKLNRVTMTGVDSIGTSAFYTCTALTNIALGDSLRALGNYAFEGCTNIEGLIKFPETLQYIGAKNFKGCREITGIDLPDGLKIIGWAAFEGCTGITRLAIPARVEHIGVHAFYGCSNIKDRLVFPATLKRIWYRAFQNCINLQSIDLSGATSLEAIEFAAFYNCKGIKGKVRIPDAVTTVEKEAFYSCDSIESLHIGASLQEIGEDAFLTFPWRNLTAITVSSSNPKYDSRDNCNAIIETATNKLYKGCMNTVIPESVTTIGKDAFISCGMYGTFNIPDAVTSIEDYAFFGCRTLDRINLSEDNNLASIGMWAFRDCEDLKDVLYLNSIDFIGFGAFQGCSKIPGIFFGSILRKIEAQAFLACYNLQHVTFWAPAPPYVGKGAFHYEFNIPMFIRCGSTAAFEEEMPEQKLFIEEGYYSLRAVSEDVEIGRVFITAPYSCETNEVTVAAVAEDGYKFAFWSDGCVLNPYTMTLTDDVSLVAYFTEHSELKYTVTAESNDSTKGTVTGSGSYIANTTATLTAVPKEGYQFIKWQDENTDNPRSVVVTSDATFTAFFEVIGAVDENYLSNVSIYAQDENIVVNNAVGCSLGIYDLTGQLLINETAIATNKLVLHMGRQGVYFVKVGKGKVKKVVVR
ncbi:MAG TPA: leucine-rich repeat protein, partial [Paludibacter sp.]|nr:leucine-rich repeat protein [Paludibacter sp.]